MITQVPIRYAFTRAGCLRQSRPSFRMNPKRSPAKGHRTAIEMDIAMMYPRLVKNPST